ncbi:MAG: hypothetical protein RLN83_07185 [Balneola sp.]
MRLISLILLFVAWANSYSVAQESKSGSLKRGSFSYQPASGQDGYEFKNIEYYYIFGKCYGNLVIRFNYQKFADATAYYYKGKKYTSEMLGSSYFENLELHYIERLNSKVMYGSSIYLNHVYRNPMNISSSEGVRSIGGSCFNVADIDVVSDNLDANKNIDGFYYRVGSAVNIRTEKNNKPEISVIHNEIRKYESNRRLDEAEDLIELGKFTEAESKILDARMLNPSNDRFADINQKKNKKEVDLRYERLLEEAESENSIEDKKRILESAVRVSPDRPEAKEALEELEDAVENAITNEKEDKVTTNSSSEVNSIQKINSEEPFRGKRVNDLNDIGKTSHIERYNNFLFQEAERSKKRKLYEDEMEQTTQRFASLQYNYEALAKVNLDVESEDPNEILRNLERSIREVKSESDAVIRETNKTYIESTTQVSNSYEESISNMTQAIISVIERNRIEKEKEEKLAQLEKDKNRAFDNIKYKLLSEYNQESDKMGKRAALALNKSNQDFYYANYLYYQCSIKDLNEKFSYNNSSWVYNSCKRPNSNDYKKNDFPNVSNVDELITFAEEKSEISKNRSFKKLYDTAVIELIDIAIRLNKNETAKYEALKAEFVNDILISVMYAKKAKDLDSLKYGRLYDRRDTYLTTSIFEAIERNDLAYIKSLASKKIIEGRVKQYGSSSYTPIAYAIKVDNPQTLNILDRIITNKEKEDYFFSAIVEDSEKIIEKFINESYNPSKVLGVSPLLMSVELESISVAEVLSKNLTGNHLGIALLEAKKKGNSSHINKLLDLAYANSTIENEEITNLSLQFGVANNELIIKEKKREEEELRQERIANLKSTFGLGFLALQISNSSVGISVYTLYLDNIGGGFSLNLNNDSFYGLANYVEEIEKKVSEIDPRRGDFVGNSDFRNFEIQREAATNYQFNVFGTYQVEDSRPFFMYLGIGLQFVRSYYKVSWEERRDRFANYQSITERIYSKDEDILKLYPELGGVYVLDGRISLSLGIKFQNVTSLNIGIGYALGQN